MVIEMPVLDNALLASALTFTPLLVALTFGEPAMKLLARATRAVPRRLLPYYGNVVLDTVRQEPGPGGRRCCRVCSSGASRRTAVSGTHSRRRRS